MINTRLTISAVLLLLLVSAALRGQSTPTLSPELAEATRLTQEVVKLYAERKFNDAYALAKRALELREKALPKDHVLVNAAVLDLAEVEYARLNYVESKGLFERVLHSYQRTMGGDNPKTVPVMERLALNYYALRQPLETEKLYKQALSIRQKAFGLENLEVAESLYSLAEFYQFQGEYQKGAPLYQQVIETRKKLKANSGQIAEALDRYSCLLRKQKRTDEADDIFAQQLVEESGTSRLITGGVINGKAVKLVQPWYPPEAIAERVAGTVTVVVLINETGDVIRACAEAGPKLLMKAAESAASRSKFTATLVDGAPVKVHGTIIYNFVAH